LRREAWKFWKGKGDDMAKDTTTLLKEAVVVLKDRLEVFNDRVKLLEDRVEHLEKHRKPEVGGSTSEPEKKKDDGEDGKGDMYRCPECGYRGTETRNEIWCPKCPRKLIKLNE